MAIARLTRRAARTLQRVMKQRTLAKEAEAPKSMPRLLNRAKSIGERVRELQAQGLAKIERKLDVSRERVGRRLDMASRLAEQQEKPSDIVAAEAQIAKVFGLAKATDQYNPIDPNSAKSM